LIDAATINKRYRQKMLANLPTQGDHDFATGRRFKPDEAAIPHVAVELVPLSAYDELAAVRAPKTELALEGGVA